jgi:hypothetical protein
LGHLRVKGFIDTNKNGEIAGKPIVSFREYQENCREDDDIIVITVQAEESRRSIINELRMANISDFFTFDWDDQYRIYDYLPYYVVYRKKTYMSYAEIIARADMSGLKKVAIYGENPYMKYLISEIKFQMEDVKIAIVDRKDWDTYDSNCDSISLEKAYYECDCIILNNRVCDDDIRFYILQNRWNKYKFLDIYDVDSKYNLFSFPKLVEWKNKYEGMRVFIIGNGPSLKIEDLETLRYHQEISFAFNKVYRVFDRTEWRPNLLAISDYSILINSQDEVRKLNCNILFADHYHKNGLCKKFDDVDYVHICDYEYNNTHPIFSDDVTKGVYCGYSVSYDIGLQLAIYAGAKEIYLIGMDHTMSGADVTASTHHFIPNYFSEEEKEAYKGLKGKFDRVTLAYEAAKEYASNCGVKIFNATRGGELEVFERVDFDSLFSCGGVE